jgi:protein-disulfide isomerase
MNRTRWIIFGAICFAILGLLIYNSKKNDAVAKFNGDASKVITQGPIADHVFGSNQQKVVFIEYGDYQCPACGRMYSTVKAITAAYQDKLTFIFRNFPLTSVHPNALAAATAAEAAGLQGKYYQMHDALYENQTTWSDVDVSKRGGLFEQYATQVGINLPAYRKDLDSKDVAAKIDRDRTTAQKYSVDATPTFILNGQKLPSATSTDPQALQKAIQDALQQAGFALDK